MKKVFFFFFISWLIMMSLNTAAQYSNLVVFSEQGEKFTVIKNDEAQNSDPACRVVVDNLLGPSFKILIQFTDPSLVSIRKTIFNKLNSTMYYVVKKNPKGVYVLEKAESEYVKCQEKDTRTSPSQVTPAPPSSKETPQQEKTAGEKGCDNPMTQEAFLVALVSVTAAPYDGPKLSAAKKLAQNHCLLASQVKEVMYTFDYEPSRLSFAKFAYDYTYDPGNYSEVNDAFQTNKSKSDLEAYLKSKK